MPFSYQETVASVGQTTVSVPFPYTSKAHVHVSIDGDVIEQALLSWPSNAQITLPTALVGGETVRVYRATPAVSPLVTFQSGAIDHRDLNSQVRQLLYVVQEAYDYAIVTGELADDVTAFYNQIVALHEDIEGWHADVMAAVGTITPVETQIAAASATTSPSGTDLLGVVGTAGALFKLTFTNLQEWVRTKLGAMISSSGAKTTPVDADQLAVSDSAASNGPAKVSFLNLWANYIKGKADAVYQPLKTILTTLGNLANAGGALINDGSGNLSWGALASGGMVLLQTWSPPSGSSLSLTSINTAYRELHIEFDGVTVSATSNCRIELSSTNGAAWGASTNLQGTDSGSSYSGVFRLMSMRVTTTYGKIAKWLFAKDSTAGTLSAQNLVTNTAAAVNAIRLSLSTGSFSGGTIRVYGVL